MSTNDVPGSNPQNNDVLSMGCWAEHNDGSLIFVEGTEDNRIIYSIFDMAKETPIEYRDAMPKVSFEKTFSCGKESSQEKWIWHDKTPFPWNRIIKKGFSDGKRLPSADHILTAAEKVAQSLQLRGKEFDEDMRHRGDDTRNRVNEILDKIGNAIDKFLK
jgi:hypothetical protein